MIDHLDSSFCSDNFKINVQKLDTTPHNEAKKGEGDTRKHFEEHHEVGN